VQDTFIQIINTLCLITGVIIGETASNKLFGFAKKWYLNIIEVVLFIIILIALFDNTYIQESNPLITAVINLIFGTTAITITRGLVSGIGFFSKRIQIRKGQRNQINETTIIIGLTRNLLRKGIDKEEIINILQNSGLNKRNTVKTVNQVDLEKKGTVGT